MTQTNPTRLFTFVRSQSLNSEQIIYKAVNLGMLEYPTQRKRNLKLANSKMVGSLNSQFGTCWIYKDGENKKIKCFDLEQFLNEGWTKGRKFNW